jgi:hypothetical protein
VLNALAAMSRRREFASKCHGSGQVEQHSAYSR